MYNIPMKTSADYITKPMSSDEVPQLDTIELLFFAYRDFVADPDLILQELDFGRAHHRTLYFINRSPGMTVAELLTILKITKQSLARVLRQLIDSGYVVQNTGENDRRKRLLYPTPKGRDLILALSAPQSSRIQKALENMQPDERKNVSDFLAMMMNQA